MARNIKNPKRGSSLVHDSRLDKYYTQKLADRWGRPYIVEKVNDGGGYVLK